MGDRTTLHFQEATPEGAADRVYFPELDGLRFFAFALVYLFHGGIPWPLLSGWVGPAVSRALRDNGRVGVQLFFILSGYLITTLLLREEARYGRIDIRAFWVRRMLRIWPLYYLTVVITFLVLPWIDGVLRSPGYQRDLAVHLPAFLAFLGNWSIVLVRPVPFLTQVILWSVCVEEQFYLIVPLLLAWGSRRTRIVEVLVLMAASVFVRWLCARSFPGPYVIYFNTFGQLDTLLAGVLLALLLGRDPKAKVAIGAWGTWLQWPLYAAALGLMSLPPLGDGPVWRKTWDFVAIWACGVGIVTLAVTHRGIFPRLLAYPRLVWLGKISYGLYMYHAIVISIREQSYWWLPWFPNKDILLTIATFAATVALAAGSYYGFERPFLKWKRSWSRIPSRPV